MSSNASMILVVCIDRLAATRKRHGGKLPV